MRSCIGTWLSALAIIGMALPLHAVDAVPPDSEKPGVIDVALTIEGDLPGIVLTQEGKPAPNTPIQVLHSQTVVAQVRSDENGRYNIHGLRGGVHTVRTVNGQTICRFWNENSAPPLAKQGLLLTTSDTVVRGQGGGSGISGETWVGIGLFVGAAVAVAVSVSDDGNAAPVTPAPASP